MAGAKSAGVNRKLPLRRRCAMKLKPILAATAPDSSPGASIVISFGAGEKRSIFLPDRGRFQGRRP